jgi:general L-amino acid transport system ATP-binding protein
MTNTAMTNPANESGGGKAQWAVEIIALNKWYGDFHVLRDINLTVARGERIVICGPSGSGKSTMLRCINRLEDWQRGRVVVDGKELTDDAKQILTVRRDIGMVFQQFNLFPHLTVLENCTLAPIWVRRMPKKDAEELAMRYLQRVRIPDQALKYPSQLSGGQQQRVAIARAFIAEPKLLLADEPTGNLDAATGRLVIDCLFEHQARRGTTLLLITHDPNVAERCDRQIHLLDGRIVDDRRTAQIAAAPRVL